MREYKQLTEEDRIEIYAMKQAGKQQNQIAAAVGVSSSTITRELVVIPACEGRPSKRRYGDG